MADNHKYTRSRKRKRHKLVSCSGPVFSSCCYCHSNRFHSQEKTALAAHEQMKELTDDDRAE